ncbi:SDR family NAD(P)-dependent oxidoreductase [Aliiroseovarius sp. YM-037]|uniref:SDR family NAD(P)-dependent oxidoreductase n=1 Tax=Aliiroseovarius sp. YM-037 TaxID=3341728 RepID=UPI003A801226
MTFAQDLAGRHAVVTGGARGLGRAIADRLAASGAGITIVDQDPQQDAMPEGWNTVACDLGAAEAQDVMGDLAARLGKVDILVANAGVVPPWRGVSELDAEEWHGVMAVNVWGVAASLGAFAPTLSQGDGGSAIVMASINGYKAHPKQVLYSASKHAVIGVMRAAALDLGPGGVRVNALAPGPIATDALLGRVAARHAEGGPDPEAVLGDMATETALRRMATEAEVAQVAHFLASDASSGMTGTVFPVEAGLA